MCGISGIISYDNCRDIDYISSMVEEIKHRGPDDFSVFDYKHEYFTLGIGHCRLSILDLSIKYRKSKHSIEFIYAIFSPLMKCFQDYLCIAV